MKRVDHKVAEIAFVAAAAFCLMSSGVFAAAPAPAKPANSMSASALKIRPLDLGPMVRPTDDPAKVALARQFIMLYHPNTDPKNINRVLDVYMPRAIAAEKKENPKVDVKKFEQEKRKHFLDNAERVMNNQAHVVSRHFTLQEMKDLSAFFASPLGRKLTAESPRITQEMRQRRRLETRQELLANAKNNTDDDEDDDEDEDDNKPAKPALSKAPAKPAVTAPAKPATPKSK